MKDETLLFSVNPTSNMLSMVGTIDFDCPLCPNSYTIIIAATNNEESQADDFDNQNSLQTVHITINDLNDNVPSFYDVPNYFVLEGAGEGCRDCRINALDLDRIKDTVLDFNITHVNASDDSINASASPDPFTLTMEGGDTAVLVPSFGLADGMTGFFELEVEVKDSKPHINKTNVFVVLMTAQNNVTFGFTNSLTEVCQHKEQIFNILQSTLGWSFTEKNQLACGQSGTQDFSEGFTQLEGYFVDKDSFAPMSQRDIAFKYDQQFEVLWMALHDELNITLDANRGFIGETAEWEW
jgi:hypothetical protein